MKKTIFAVIAAVIAFAMPSDSAQARNAHQGKHLKDNPPYDCSVTKKPSKPQWLDQRMKKEKFGNGKIELIWEDADRAHDVEIKWGRIGGSMKTKKAADDGDETFKSLKNGQAYVFKVRGVSNCGKSGWTREYKFLP